MEEPPQSDARLELLLERTMDLVRQAGRDLSLRQIAILLVCDSARNPQTVRGLAQYLEIVKPAVTRAVNRLETAGFVRRKPDPRDRRSVLVVSTASGRRYALQFLGRAKAGTEAVLSKKRPGGTTAGRQHPDEALLGPAQVREARDLLGWSQSRLAGMAEMTAQSVIKFERGKLQLSRNDLQAIRGALEAAGVQFIAENDGAGVRVRKPE